MDKTAIEKIQHLAVQAAHSDNIGIAATPLAALHKDFLLHSLEPYMLNRSRMRGEFLTHLSSEFATYYRQHHNEHSGVFIATEDLSAAAIFNLGNEEYPGHCDHTARLKLRKTREFQALLNLDIGPPLGQRELADWIEDWRDFITPHDKDGEEVEIKRFISAVRNIEINAQLKSEHSDGDFSGSKSTLEQIEASSRHELPAGFLFCCHPYQELKQRDIYVRLRVMTGTDAPRLGARIVSKESLHESLQREFSDHLRTLLPDPKPGVRNPILIGEFKP